MAISTCRVNHRRWLTEAERADGRECRHGTVCCEALHLGGVRRDSRPPAISRYSIDNSPGIAQDALATLS